MALSPTAVDSQYGRDVDAAYSRLGRDMWEAVRRSAQTEDLMAARRVYNDISAAAHDRFTATLAKAREALSYRLEGQ